MVKQRNHFRLRTVAIPVLLTVLAVAVSVHVDDTKLSKKAEIKSLIANERTAADHERIAQHFDAEAAK